MHSTKPIRKPGILGQDIGDETLLYSAEEQVMYLLNPAAKRVWELCDGAHSTDDIEKALWTSFSVTARHETLQEVRCTLGVLAGLGLLQEG